MGTRADFYVGRGEAAEWLGSIGWDGYPDGIPDSIKGAASEADFRSAATAFFASRDDATLPEQGWPWPWDTSHTTDYAYAFDVGQVHASCFGSPWWPATEEEPGTGEVPTFPDMSERKATTLGPRSGLLIVGT